MSIILHGHLPIIEVLAFQLKNYKELCLKIPVSDSHNIEGQSLDLSIITKYYSADVSIQLVCTETSSEASLLENAEGYILAITDNEVDLSAQKFDLSRAAIEADTGLKIIVVITEGEVTQRSVLEEWALDNGFEYIEVNSLDPTKDHHEREKSGLPRLMEALESNMWSTMRRTPKTVTPASSALSSAVGYTNSSSSGEPVADVNTTSVGNEQIDTDAVAQSLAATTLSTADTVSGSYQPPVPVSVVQEQSAQVGSEFPPSPPAPVTAESLSGVSNGDASAKMDPFESERADKEDNEIVDKFADFISEAKNFREQATGGQLSDQARRHQAAEMALRLAQLMDLDEDSSSGSCSDDDESR